MHATHFIFSWSSQWFSVYSLHRKWNITCSNNQYGVLVSLQKLLMIFIQNFYSKSPWVSLRSLTGTNLNSVHQIMLCSYLVKISWFGLERSNKKQSISPLVEGRDPYFHMQIIRIINFLQRSYYKSFFNLDWIPNNFFAKIFGSQETEIIFKSILYLELYVDTAFNLSSLSAEVFILMITM